jgi:DNA helicase-2/ATP-dependent DNA helicase PcrA
MSHAVDASEIGNSSLFADLNPPQLEAAEHFEGPILVLAGAGSGKTRVLTRRIAYLVLDHGVEPASILAVTFTNKAVEEMKQRLRSLLGARAEELWVATFHSAALKILRHHAHRLEYRNDFIVYDDGDSQGVIKRVLANLNIDHKKYPPQYFSRIIDQAKNNFISDKEFIGQSKVKLEALMQENVYRAYQEALFSSNAMDFGDLLVNAVRILNIPEIISRYREAINFILIDEYQDTNHVQYLFIKQLAQPKNNLLVVGDDDQSIYAFRGATVRNILEFEDDFKDAKVIKLEQNYRSTANILDAAHAVISKNTSRKEKKLWTERREGEKILTYVAEDEGEEARFIAKEISKLKANGSPYSSCAIFYRMNAQSRALEEALVANRIPYRIFGGLKFYDRKEIKDILAYLRLLLNPNDDQAFLRVINTPPRGIGPQSLVTVDEEAKKNKLSLMQTARIIVDVSKKAQALRSFINLFDELLQLLNNAALPELIGKVDKLSGYTKYLSESKDPTFQSRIENIEELKGLASQFEKSENNHLENLSNFLDRTSLTSSADLTNEDKNSHEYVSLMTLHLAKGLEFQNVFLAGVEEGVLPHYRSIDDKEQLEEERRLAYVGITRAMRILYLTRARARAMFSSYGFGGSFRKASRFANDLPKECLRHINYDFVGNVLFDVGVADQFHNLGRSTSRLSCTDLKPGLRVCHSVFGSGVVVAVEEGRDASTAVADEIVVNFSGSTKRLMLKYAKLWLE